jgi:hypothetical protein
MRKQMIENAAYEVATQCRTVEDSLDAALAEIVELQSRMVRARAVAPVGFATGQEALEKVAETVAALIEARGAMAGCHSALARVRGKVPGLRTVSYGDVEECPPPSGVADLRIVA